MGIAVPAPAQSDAIVAIADYAEIREHEFSTNDYSVPTEWRDAGRLSEQTFGGAWTVAIVVDEDGSVISADVDAQHSALDHLADVRAAAMRLRFAPFERNGRPTRVRFTTQFFAEPADYMGREDRTFPTAVDLLHVRIRLDRTACYGSCPDYHLEIDGDGHVLYQGHSGVLVIGEHRWTIPQSNVRELIELFRRADYFRLDGYYQINATDLPTFVTGLEIGDQRKFVLDYGWGGMGGAVASTSFGGFEGNPMPAIVSEIENAIDRLSDAGAYVRGDATTILRLRAEAWDFSSPGTGGAALAHLLANCNIGVARAFIAEGAPLVVRGDRSAEREAQHVVLLTPGCGDLEFIQELVGRGALRNRRVADGFLARAVSSGYPDIVALALQHSRNVSQGENGGLLGDAVMAYADEDGPNYARFNEAGVVRLLLEAGANPRERDPVLGDTPLHNASSAETARLLIEAGADPNARNEDGETPLFNRYFPEVYPVLIAAGADLNARNVSGYTSLYAANSPEAITALVALGANVNDVAADGKTPIEVVGNAESMQAMLDAGARLPEQRDRIAAILARTAYWDTLPPALAERATALGLSQPVRERQTRSPE